MHPTVKPVALVAEAIKDCSRRGEIVLDCFGGSGTTLIAAEKAGRQARLIEFDPAHCDADSTSLRANHRQTGSDRRNRPELRGRCGSLQAELHLRRDCAMSDRPNDSGGGDFEVGYGKPPLRTRFSKGQSGNAGGRPRGMTAGRAKALALKEAYRMVNVKAGDRIIALPALQAILRSQIALAAKGNGPAQRAVIEAVQAIEREVAAQAAAETKDKANERPMSDIEVARRIAFLLDRGKRALEFQEKERERRRERQC